jgi:hypothetical protein
MTDGNRRAASVTFASNSRISSSSGHPGRPTADIAQKKQKGCPGRERGFEGDRDVSQHGVRRRSAFEHRQTADLDEGVDLEAAAREEREDPLVRFPVPEDDAGVPTATRKSASLS